MFKEKYTNNIESEADKNLNLNIEKAVSPEDKAQRLRYALKRSVESQPADALLLSGGIDSGLLAALDPKTPAITVVLKNEGVDTRHAQKVAEHFDIPWHLIEISQEQALSDLRTLIRLTKSYDLGLLNDIPIYEGIKYALSMGWEKIRTGDAADTLFAGYSYLHGKHFDFKSYLKSLIPHLAIPSSEIGRVMGAQMIYPYLHPEVIDNALNLDLSDNVVAIETERPGDFHTDIVQRKGKNKWGKIVLRNAAYGILPENLIWRTKTDLEYGSGMSIIEEHLTKELTPEEEKELIDSGKHFWNKAHGKLYLIAKLERLEIEPPKDGEYACTWCGGGIPKGRHHCKICGAHPSDKKIDRVFENEKSK